MPSDQGKRKRRAQEPTFQFLPSTGSNSSDLPSEPKIRHVQLKVSDSVVSRTSYLSVTLPEDSYSASAQDEIPWQDTPQSAAVDDDLVPLERAPKSKRVAGVSSPYTSLISRLTSVSTEDYALRSWKDSIDTYLAELLRHEGRGGFSGDICLRCNIGQAEYRCTDCFTGQLWCKSCIVDLHMHNPLHRVQARLPI
jgi:hypothetical protein